MDTANKTALELQNMPNCRQDTLHQLSLQYNALVGEIRKNMKINSNILKPFSPYSTSNYLFQKQTNVNMLAAVAAADAMHEFKLEWDGGDKWDIDNNWFITINEQINIWTY